MIFVSTGGQRNKTATETALDYYSHGIANVELSGGVFSPTYESDLLALPGDMVLQVHNYFPPTAQPFVFNLASCDPATAESSLKHAREAIRLAVVIRRPVFSFHAGFRIDPRVSELGKELAPRRLVDRSKALKLFSERIALLADEAKHAGVELLIENNVLSAGNLTTYGEDPLLLTQPEEISEFMERAPANVALLLDVAHLKVSAKTFGFDLSQAHEQLKPWIRAYHLSDNDGTADSNDPVTEASWFWEYLIRGLDYYSLEVYGTSVQFLFEQVSLVREKLSIS